MNCTSCGTTFEGQPGAECPHCGTVSAAEVTSPPGDVPPAPAEPPPPPPNGPPWEERPSLASMLETIKGVLIDPVTTFRNASKTAGLGSALLFGLILGVAGNWIGIFWSYFTSAAFSDSLGDMLPPEFESLLQTSGSSMILWAVLAPVLIVVSLFLWAAIVHLMLLLFGGAKHGFETTFRTVAYATGSTALFQALPFCGVYIGGIWSIVAQIIGLKEMHGIPTGKAVAAVLLPIFLCCCAAFALIVAIISMAAGVAGGGF